MSKETISKNEVTGSRFTTAPLVFPFDRKEGKMRVVWNNGNAWRLRMLARGNDPWALPGKEILFDHEILKRSIDENRAVIVVSGPHSGLTSFYHWSTHCIGGRGVLPIDLREAEFQGENSQEKLRLIAETIKREFQMTKKSGDLNGFDEPMDLITRLGGTESSLDAIMFRGFEALDKKTAIRFYGGLRSLLEHPGRPLGSLGVILLGQSVEALDIQDGEPISKLVSLSDVYTMTELHKDEIEDMYRHAPGLPEMSSEDFSRLHDWVGGEPLLAHAIFQLLVEEEGERRCKSVSDAIEFLTRERLPAFEIWFQSLVRQLREQPAIAAIVDRLLRKKEYPNKASDSRMPLTILFVNNWIRLDLDKNTWKWRSGCREALAREALIELNFE